MRLERTVRQRFRRHSAFWGIIGVLKKRHNPIRRIGLSE